MPAKRHQLCVVVIQRIACHSLAVVSSEYPVTLLGVLAEAAQPVKVLAPSHLNHPALPHLAGFSQHVDGDEPLILQRSRFPRCPT